ncbi:hypothetical protein ABZW18_03545 [Streptomyces sp. NPDC004647]|uniref:hypothetical protein n=1 Tax=Streptomyces sp. NPDC004647 TaxID=3154671 RepID=UPI0033A4AECB
MFEKEMHQARQAQLIREAEEYRLARQATRGRRRRGRRSAEREAEGRVSGSEAREGRGSVRAARA